MYENESLFKVTILAVDRLLHDSIFPLTIIPFLIDLSNITVRE